MPDERQSRKDRSIAILKAEGVPTIDHLPCIEEEAETIRRTTEEIADRAIALFVVSLKGFGLDDEATEAIERFGIRSSLTPCEAEFIDCVDPSKEQRTPPGTSKAAERWYGCPASSRN